jgi:xenotropic and polytropic retrovirus receptor 1
MKAMIYQAVEEAPAVESVEEDILKRHFANFDESFFNYCDKELKKINTFYSEKLAEATRKFATLNNELKIALEGAQKSVKGKPHQILKKKSLPYKKIQVRMKFKCFIIALIYNFSLQEFKLAFSEFYLSLILLQNYQSLNHTGFRKILKKHDKLLKVDNGFKWNKDKVENSHFFTNRDIDKIIHDTENTVTTELEEGDRQKAMKRLRVPPLGEQQSPWTTFKVGLFSGGFIVLFIAVILSTIFYVDDDDNENTSNLKTLQIAFRLYRAPFLLVLFIFLIGINIYGWRSAGVNHVLIFELDPRNHLSEQHLMELAGIFGVIWAISVLSFLYSNSLSIPPFINPLSLIFVMVLFVCNPFKVFRWEARFWLMRTTVSI